MHLERSRHEAILVGRGTYAADAPGLDVRLAGLEGWSPRRLILTHQPGFRADNGRWEVLASPADIIRLENVDHLFVEGGAATAAAFLGADLIDRLLLYRAPIVIGGGRPATGQLDMTTLTEAHGKWKLLDARALGSDRLEVYERVRE